MSDKASSDLDIFDGLAAKKSRPAPPGMVPSVPPPPGSRVPPPSMTRQKTLLGLAAPGPSVGGSRPPGAPPPPPSLRTSAPPPPAPSKVGSPPPPAPPPLGAMGLGGTLVTPPPPPPPAPAITSLAIPPPNPFGPGPEPLAAPPREEEPTPEPLNGEAAKVNGAPKPGVDIDWDDEDEATTVFDRTQEDSLRSLLRSAPPPPAPAAGAPAPGRFPSPVPAAGAPAPSRVGPPAPRTSVPPPSLPRAPLPPPPRSITTSSMPAPMPMATQPIAALPSAPPMSHAPSYSESPYDRAAGQKRIMLVAAAALVVVLVAVVLILLPKSGSVVVTVAGPGNKAVGELEVLIDGKKACSTSPCQVKDLSAGIHLVKVTASGYQSTADQAVKIASGDEAGVNIVLTRGSGGSGLSVRSEGRGLKLVVDGKDIGPLPQELPDLAPGDHQVKIDGGDRYEQFEKTVTVSPEQMLTLEPKLKVKKGLATIKPGLNADGAKVVLVSGSERRPVPSLPLAVDIPGDKPYSVVASKRGFQDFEHKLEFEDGQAERTFVIDMVPPVAGGSTSTSTSDSGARAHSTPSPGPAPGPSPTPAVREPATPKPPAGGNGTLTLNSIPVSNVILDGRPLGSTPKLNVSVSPGNHTVIFVHPEKGRKAKSVTVQAGKSTPVVVKF